MSTARPARLALVFLTGLVVALVVTGLWRHGLTVEGFWLSVLIAVAVTGGSWVGQRRQQR
ncbi:MAG: hypothetical protein ACTHQ3_22980 [Motilibacteraceae bacterium]